LWLTTKDIFLHQTIAELAVGVDRELAPGLVDEVVVRGPAPLTPIQRWFFETEAQRPDHFTMSMSVELAEDVDGDALRRSVDALVAHHDVLRMRFEFVDGQWRQDVAPVESADVLRCCDLSGLDGAGQQIAMQQAAVAAETGLSITGGPLLRVVLFTLGAGQPSRLFW
jgi:hypothetical protein